MTSINPLQFYSNWDGHTLDHLTSLLSHLTPPPPATPRPVIYFAGDSSLDNKAWLFTDSKLSASQLSDDRVTSDAVNGYEKFLDPPRCVMDVAYWVNKLSVDRWGKGDDKIPTPVTINTAIEATTLGNRSSGLLPQDAFIRDHITPNDTLVVSVGANDIALAPSNETIMNLGLLLRASAADIAAGKAPGLEYFLKMFGDDVKTYVSRMISKQKPRKILICMIYFPLEYAAGGDQQSSWASQSLSMMGYDLDPSKLQEATRAVYEIAVKKIQIEGTEVEAVPLFEVMNGKRAQDYVARVEPSVEGGKRMAAMILERY